MTAPSRALLGNIAGHCFADWPADDKEQTMEIARFSVNLARAIVEEVERTEEKADD